MRIAIISKWYSAGMTYSENLLPAALAREGHQVFLLTSDFQVYGNSLVYAGLYERILGPAIGKPGRSEALGVVIVRIPHNRGDKSQISLPGLEQVLEQTRPDIVQSLEIDGQPTAAAARYCQRFEVPFFVECHVHMSTLGRGMKSFFGNRIRMIRNRISSNQRLINSTSVRCYAIANDVVDVAKKVYGFPKERLTVQPLGVDVEMFFPRRNMADEDLRGKIREDLGFDRSDFICIYTGRFSEDKNPHCLARAVAELRSHGQPIRGLFVGAGTRDQRESLAQYDGCLVLDFVPAQQLRGLYWCADLGVWPREESTSQLDALACGLPVVLSNRISVKERVSGCGATYNEGDHLDLASIIGQFDDMGLRLTAGAIGAAMVREHFSWERISRARIDDYKGFLAKVATRNLDTSGFTNRGTYT